MDLMRATLFPHQLLVKQHVCIYVFMYVRKLVIIYKSQSLDQPGKVANPLCGQLNRGKIVFPLHARKFGLAIQVGPSRPTAAVFSLSTLRLLNLVLTHGIPPAFLDGVHLFISPTAIGQVRG